jgi:RNA polymerase sigma-70 factor (ECF subfamily)
MRLAKSTGSGVEAVTRQRVYSSCATNRRPPTIQLAYNLEAAVLACAAGDQTALKKIYEREAPWLLRVAYRIVGRRDIADDVIQDAFLQIWQQAHSFDPSRGSVRGWIYSVVRNRALKVRRARLREPMVDDRVLLAIFDGGIDATTRLPEECELRRRLAGLDPKRRASLILAYVDGCTHREIATQLGVPIGTAKAWIRRSLIALRADLDSAGNAKEIVD